MTTAISTELLSQMLLLLLQQQLLLQDCDYNYNWKMHGSNVHKNVKLVVVIVQMNADTFPANKHQ